MKTFNLLTITGEYWHYHAIGTGMIFTYNKTAKQVVVLCSANGTIIDVINNKNYNSIQDFKKEASGIYIDIIDCGDTSLDINFYDNPTIVGNGMVEVDFDLIKN